MAAQAGWYVDPKNAGQYRYWDGERWSQSTQPIPESTVSGLGVDAGTTGSLASGGTPTPIGTAAFDQAAVGNGNGNGTAPAAGAGSGGAPLADFMWTSGFGDGAEDTSSSATTMFTPEASAPPAAPTPPIPEAPATRPAASAEAATPGAPLFQPGPTSFGGPPAGTTGVGGGGSLFSAPPIPSAPTPEPTPTPTPTPSPTPSPTVPLATPTPTGSLFESNDSTPGPVFGTFDQGGSSSTSSSSGASAPPVSRRRGRGKAEAPSAPAAAAAGDTADLGDGGLEGLVGEYQASQPAAAATPEVQEQTGKVKVKRDRHHKSPEAELPKPPKQPKPPKSKTQKGKNEPKSKLPLLLGILAVVLLGGGAFMFLSGGEEAEPEAASSSEATPTTVADVATPTTVVDSAESTAPATGETPTTAVDAATPSTAPDGGASTSVAGVTTTIATGVDATAMQAAFDAEAERACNAIKADPGLFTESVMQYNPAWSAIGKNYESLQRAVNECSAPARDEAFKRIAALEAAAGNG